MTDVRWRGTWRNRNDSPKFIRPQDGEGYRSFVEAEMALRKAVRRREFPPADPGAVLDLFPVTVTADGREETGENWELRLVVGPRRGVTRHRPE